jgi:hypothetical protein
LPQRLSDLVGEMLAKDPRARPQSMEEISWRLQHLYGNHPPFGERFQPEHRSGVRDIRRSRPPRV